MAQVGVRDETRATGAAGPGAALSDDGVQARIAEIERRYELREPEEVRAFLREHPDLLDILVEGSEIIPRFLAPSGPIVLAVSWDPEDDDDPGELFALAPTPWEPEEIAPRMAELREAWVIDVFRRSQGFFNVGVEYR